jgi:photosystem II stability/assembly factor-like uncharacterized protein
MRRAIAVSLVLLLSLFVSSPANAKHDEAIHDRFRPTSVAFWDMDHGVIAGQVGRHSLIAVTDDGGRSWKQTWRSATKREVTRVAIAGDDSAWAEVEACRTCRNRLLHSFDGGLTWAHIARTRLTDVSFIDDTEGWALWEKRWNSPVHGSQIKVIVKKTHDAGDTWTRLSSACRNGYWREGAALSRVGADEAWVACASEPATAQQKKIVTHTIDGGGTWQRPGEPLWDGHLSGIFFTETGHGWMWLSHGTLERTTDGARTWDATRFFEPDLDWISTMWFVDGLNGYATYQNGDRGGAQQLIVTHDGGRTWKVRQTWH